MARKRRPGDGGPKHRRGAEPAPANRPDRHPPTGPITDAAGVGHLGKESVRLLSGGDSFLAAWLEAMRGEPLTEADYQAAGLDGQTNALQ
jgi:hypothetical protein